MSVELTENATPQHYHLAKLTEEENEYATRIAVQMWSRGFKWREIAEAINAELPEERHVTLQAVHAFVNKIRKGWKEDNRELVNSYYAQALGSLEAMEQEAWREWERSKQESITQTVNTTESDILHEPVMDGGAKGAPEVVGKVTTTNKSMTKRNSTGDTRYLELILRAQERRARLLGLDAPVKVSNPDGSPLTPSQTNIQINVAEVAKANPDYAKDISELSLKLGLSGAFSEPTGAGGERRQMDNGSASEDAGGSDT